VGIEPLVGVPMMNMVADLEEGLTMEVACQSLSPA
jgi:hypothetical protein